MSSTTPAGRGPLSSAAEPSAAEEPTGQARRSVRASLPPGSGPWIAAFALVAVVTAILGYLRLMTSLVVYDDEGYMMVMTREFLERGGLYDDVYSQYGPFFSQFWGAIVGGLGLDLNHNLARGLVLAGWLATSGLLGLSLWRITRSGALGVLTQLLTFVALGSLVNEPLHPGGLICLLLAAIVAVVAFGLPSRPAATAVLAGVLLAALSLVKINVGALATVAALTAAALTLPGLADRRAVRRGVVALALLAPLVLMANDLGETPTQRYAVIVLAAVGSVAITAWPAAPATEPAGRPAAGRAGARFVAIGAVAMAATAIVICLIAVVTGSSPGGLVDGILIAPLGLSDAFQIPFDFPTGAVDLALLGLGAAVLVRRTGAFGARGRAIVSLVAGGVMLWAIADPGLSGLLAPETIALAVALPFAWVAVLGVQRADVSPARRFVIVFVVALAVLQTLHAYPVAGSQINFATFLLVPVGALCLGAAWPVAGRLARVGQVAVVLAAVLMAKVALQGVIEPLRSTQDAYANNTRLPLLGADRLRVGQDTASNLRQLTLAIDDRCSTFLSLPGMNALYLYTGQRPPTGLNAGDWMYLFDEETQQRVVDATAGKPRLCVVRNDKLLASWSQGKPVPDLPLYRFVTTGVEPIGTYGDYTLERKRP